MESLDYDSRQIKKSTILNLATMGFIGNATNLVITGPTGAGKTYLACALGIEACKQTYRVMYIRMPDLMRNFENLRENLRELTKYRKRMGNYQLLILDEWLNYKITEKDAKILYELFEQRSGNNPTIFVKGFILSVLFITSIFEKNIYEINSLFLGFIIASIPLIVDV